MNNVTSHRSQILTVCGNILNEWKHHRLNWLGIKVAVDVYNNVSIADGRPETSNEYENMGHVQA